MNPEQILNTPNPILNTFLANRNQNPKPTLNTF